MKRRPCGAGAALGAWLPIDAKAVAGALARGRSSAPLVAMLMAQERVFGPAVWAEIAAQGDADAVVLRFVALQRAIGRARVHSLVPDARDHYVARGEMRIIMVFVCGSSCRTHSQQIRILSLVEQAGEELALAKRVRSELFGKGGSRTPWSHLSLRRLSRINRIERRNRHVDDDGYRRIHSATRVAWRWLPAAALPGS